MPNDNFYFGVVRWCNDDIVILLDEMGIAATQENIDEVRVACENSHHFTDAMVEAGWLAIQDTIQYLFKEGGRGHA